MRRLLAAPVAVLVIAALPAAAVAKEVKSATICGAAGCKTAKDNAAVVAAVENGGPPSTPPSRAAAFYRVTVRIVGDPVPLRLLVAPAISRLRAQDGTWLALPQRSVAAWRAVVGDVKAFPASKLRDIDPSAPPTVRGGALAPQTYGGAPAEAADESSGPPVALLAGAGAALAALAIMLLGVRRRIGAPRAPGAPSRADG
jgi:hypothetical protein